MDYFADEAVLASLSARLDGQADASGELLVEIAWHLRQRDTQRALVLTQQLASAPPLSPSLQARLNLVNAEAAMLFGDFARAKSLASQVAEAATQHHDHTACGDANLLMASLAHGRGDLATFLKHTEEAARCYSAANDPQRKRLANAWASLARVYADARLDDRLAADPADVADPAVTVLLGLATALRCFHAGDHAQAAAELLRLIEPAEQVGMLHWRLHIGVSLSSAFASLGDQAAALNCLEQTLTLARQTGWPLVIGDALALLGSQACELGQAERAIALLTEAEQWLRVSPDSRVNAQVRCYLGRAELLAGEHALALTHARQAQTAQTHAVQIDATLVAARALLQLGNAEAAVIEAERAVTLSEHYHLPAWQVEALRTLAEIVTAQAAPASGRNPLVYLERAHAVVEQLGGHSEAVPLLNQLSQAYEAAGELALALRAERQARAKASRAERNRVHNLRAALEMRYQAERQRTDAEHQRDLMQAEAARARELEASLAVLDNLSRIGREILTNLDLSNVLNALVTHLGKLMQVNYVGLSVLESNGRLMVRRAMEDGRPLMERRVSIDDPNSQAALCARARHEILTHVEPGQRSASHIPGTQVMHTSWFGPLLASDELVGVLTIQSAAAAAYGEREQLILRTLSAYVAVAVANARAYTRLGEQHARLMLVEAEMRRLATTDALTGIPNRRHFLHALASETRRTRRTGRPMSVIMADIDHFKLVNDTLGHAAGDVVLARVAKVLDANKRAVDTVGRLGGEEFALLLPETDVQQAAEVADRLRSLVAAETLLWEGRAIPVTISMGCAMLAAPVDGSNEAAQIEALLKAADHALYQAKDAGRNCTAWSHGEHGGIIDALPGGA